jgi:DNA-binding CsgD family transcriptional regulator
VDPIALIEQSYSPYVDRQAWLRALAPIVVEAFDDDGVGAGAYFMTAQGTVEDFTWLPSPGSPLDAEKAFEILSVGVAEATPEQMAATLAEMRRPGVSSLVDTIGSLSRRVLEISPIPLQDSPGVFAPTGEHAVAVFTTMTTRRVVLEPHTRALWHRIAIHLAAAVRLVGRPRDPDAKDVELVLEPNGRTAHATGAAKNANWRELVRTASERIDHARSRAGRSDAMHALELWHGLVAGRWSLVDHFDSDGRRYILARKNDPRLSAPAALSPRERQVVFYASVGWALKEIAYALGLSISTISGHLARALQKLGIGSRSELLRLSGELATSAFASEE